MTTPDAPPASLQSAEAQKRHYDRIAQQYEAHYEDPCSRSYRERFIEAPMLDGIDLRGRRVLEAMCGSGQTTAGLLARGAQVIGLDISEAFTSSFQARWPECETVCAAIADSGLPTASVDAVVVVAGLHHLHPHVIPAIDELHRVLRPGGFFCFLEPHRGSIPDWFRQRWYRYDPLFMANEAAIDLDALKQHYADRFEFVKETYGGNIGFLLVFNSMVFRMPLAVKRLYTPALLRMEAALNRLQGQRLACVVACQWRKKAAASPRHGAIG
jgi:SAM-dependent methyltransferase